MNADPKPPRAAPHHARALAAVAVAGASGSCIPALTATPVAGASGSRIPTPPLALAAVALFVFASSSTLLADPDADPAYAVKLNNGDLLSGSLNSFDSTGDLVMRHPFARDPITLPAHTLASIEALPGQHSDDPEGQIRITLANGDSLPASIPAADGANFLITTPFSGEISVPLEKIARIDFDDLYGRRLLSGPGPQDGWRYRGETPAENPANDSQNPLALNGARIEGSIPSSAWPQWRLPDKFSLEFEVEWNNRLALGVAIFAETPDDVERAGQDGHDKAENPREPDGEGEINPILPDPEQDPVQAYRNAITLHFTNHNAALFRHEHGASRTMIGNTMIPRALGRGNKASIRIVADRATGTVGLYINDQFQDKWTEPAGPPGHGRGIVFWITQQQNRNAIGNLVVREWNGEFQRSITAPERETDIITTKGGDRLLGTLGPIDADGWHLKSEQAEMVVALEEINEVVRRAPDTEEAGTPREALARHRLRLNGRFALSATTVSLDQNNFQSTHPDLGPLSIPSPFLSGIDFHKPSTPQAP